LRDFNAFDAEPAVKDKKPPPLGRAIRSLVDTLAEPLPEDLSVVLCGSGINKSKKLFKTCAERGEVHLCEKPELTDRDWREQIGGRLQQQAHQRGMRLDRRCCEYLIDVVGVETARIPQELEKVLCYAGTEPTLQQVMEICAGTREAVFYALNTAFGERDLAAAFRTIDQFLGQPKNTNSECIRLVRMTSNFFRELLDLRLLLAHLKVRNPRDLGKRLKALSPAEETRFGGHPMVGRHPFFVGSRATEATRYQPAELLRAVHLLAVADRQLVSSSLPRRMVLETLTMQIITGA